MIRITLPIAMILGLTACSHSWDTCGETYCLDVDPPQHLGGVGSGQGLEVRDSLIWVIGDAETGIARGFRLGADDRLQPSGDVVALTVDGRDRIPHPTGFTHQPGVGTFLGNTVGGRGEIHIVDWQLATLSRTLDGALIHVVNDELAIDGARPELVWADNRWLLATADYGAGPNELRLYDPEMLYNATSTTEANVLVYRLDAPTFVQSLHYWPAQDVLIFVRNRRSGDGWTLTLVDLGQSLNLSELVVLDSLDPGAPGELEGLHFIDDERVLMITSSRVNNGYLGRLSLRKPQT